MALIALLAGAIGWLMRRQEIQTIFDPHSGLAERGALVTIVLIVFCVLTVGLLFGLSFTANKRELHTFTDAFGGSLFGSLLLTLFGIAILVFSGAEWFALAQSGDLDPFAMVRLGVGVLAGFCLALMAILGHRGIHVAIPSAIPVFWLCAWLIVSHIDRAADPVLLSYVYQLFAKAALLLALYHTAGYAFRQNRPGRLMFWSSVAIFFTGVAMGDEMALSYRATLLALAATVLIYQILLTKNLARPAWKDTPYMERDFDEGYNES